MSHTLSFDNRNPNGAREGAIFLYLRTAKIPPSPFALFNPDETIGGDFCKPFGCAARPANLKRVDDGSFFQTEMEPRVVLGKITAAASTLSDLHEIAGRRLDPRAERAAVAFAPDQLDL